MSGSVTRSTKRKADNRLSDVVSATSPKRGKTSHVAPEKHAQFWYLDGNIIIQIENVQYKLHRSIMSQHSVFFTGLFASNGNEYEGVKTEELNELALYDITCKGVKAVDFDILLDTLRNAIQYRFCDPSFDDIASILRVSTLLDFPHFRTFAVDCMEDAWENPDDPFSKWAHWHGRAAHTVTLARTYRIPTILKPALYQILKSPTFADDEDIQANFSLQDMVHLLKTREKLAQAWLSIATAGHTSVCVRANGSLDPCPSTNSRGRMVGWYKVVDAKMIQKYKYDPIGGLIALTQADWTGEVWKNLRFCDDCFKEKRVAWETQKIELWDTLDECQLLPQLG